MLSKLRFAIKNPLFTLKFVQRELLRRWRKLTCKPTHIPRGYGGSPLPTHFFEEADFSSYRNTEAADKILKGDLCIYGKRPFNVGGSIDWHTDYLSDFTWPSNVFGHDIVYKYPVGTDIKNPWEVSRAHHLVTVAATYKTTGDERYAQYVTETITDWIQSNSFYLGVNWKVAMEVGIRAGNWLLAYDLISDSPAANAPAFKRLFLGSLAEHGQYIMENLEIFGVKSNHYMSDLIGLVWIGTLCPSLPKSKKWLAYGLKELDIEILHQFHPDGVNFEASIAYHRLVLELVAYTDLLIQRHRQESLSPEARDRIKAAFKATRTLLKENGQGPQFGDNDTGRFFIFSNYHDWVAMDMAYLLDLGAICFPELDAGPQSQELGWLAPAVTRKSEFPSNQAYFEDGGQLVARKGPWQLNVNLAGIGQDGNGGHNHDDAGSFELTYKGINVVVDPGTGYYTGNPEIRNRFRSASLHNGPIIEDLVYKPSKLLFVGGAFTQATLKERNESNWKLLLTSEAYSCERTLALGDKGLTVTDVLVDKKDTEIRTLLTFSPELKVGKGKQEYSVGKELVLTTTSNSSLTNGDYSPGYSTIVPTSTIAITGKNTLTFSISKP